MPKALTKEQFDYRHHNVGLVKEYDKLSPEQQEAWQEGEKKLAAHALSVSAEVNGPQEIIETPLEAYEVAHATQLDEEILRARILPEAGRVAASPKYDTTDLVEIAGSLTTIDVPSKTPGLMEDATDRQLKIDATTNNVREAYENGAEFLDLTSDEFTVALAEAPVYRKSAIVKARKATPGEVVVTVTPDGVEEGTNTAGEDDHVVTGVNGADFILPGEKFNKLYEETEEAGVFQSRGMARIIDNPTGKKIGILAPWGEMQYGDSESKIAVQYDPKNPDEIGIDRYILDKTEFAAYKEA